MAADYHDGGGALYRLDRHGRSELVVPGLTIPNGPAWSPDGSSMYVVDSRLGSVQEFAFDGERGMLSDRRTVITIPRDDGYPDGLTVDAAGDLWIALYRGGCVQRYSPSRAHPRTPAHPCVYGRR